MEQIKATNGTEKKHDNEIDGEAWSFLVNMENKKITQATAKSMGPGKKVESQYFICFYTLHVCVR